MSAPAASRARRIDQSSAGPAPIRLLIVDDSPVARAVLERMLSAAPGFEVAATAAGASEALAILDRTRVDVVLLDLEMPGASGVEALPEIVGRGRGAGVLIVSSFCDGRAEAAIKASPEGRVDILAKPGSGGASGRFSELLVERLRAMADRSSGNAGEQPRPRRLAPAPRVGCLAIGASTGGLNAVTALIRALPPRLGAPILVTQHLPAVFVPFFARQLETGCGRRADIARDGDPLRSDEILLAPGDAHLSLERVGAHVRVRLDRETESASGCLPSVDVMLAGLAETYGRSAVAVILSGMGRDGADGARLLAEAGGAILAQDRDSSAVWGMPGAIVEAGLAAAVLPPAGIAARIAARLERAAWT